MKIEKDYEELLRLFNFFREKLNLTDGNLASHLQKLENAGYIKIKKTFFERRPRTIYTITKRESVIHFFLDVDQ